MIWHFPNSSFRKVVTCVCFWRRKRQPTPVFMPGKSHGPRSLVGYNPWGCKESDMTEQLLCVCVFAFLSFFHLVLFCCFPPISISYFLFPPSLPYLFIWPCVYAKLLVRLFATLWTVACQALRIQNLHIVYVKCKRCSVIRIHLNQVLYTVY